MPVLYLFGGVKFCHYTLRNNADLDTMQLAVGSLYFSVVKCRQAEVLVIWEGLGKVGGSQNLSPQDSPFRKMFTAVIALTSH